MIFKLLSIVVLIHTARCKPQLLTFENGQVGVNFGGYHAEAGLGGLLTGNAAHGGLSASAGTPFGQKAGAGLGGSLDGNKTAYMGSYGRRTAGGLYAGASAGHGVGASAALGGGLGDDGGHGGATAESHVGSVSKKVVKLTGTQPESVKTVTYVDEVPPSQFATYNKGFSASNTFNAQSSVNSGVNAQSSIGSTYNAQSQLGSVAAPSTIDTAPQQVYVQKFKKRLHHHHARPSYNKVLTIEKRVQVPQYVTNTQAQTNIQSGWGQQQQQSGVGFDYRKFFDFGFFANTAAGFGGQSQQQPQQQHHVKTVTVENTVPQVTYERRVVPKVVYEERIVPQVIIEKKIVPETVIVEKTIHTAPVTTTFDKEVKVEKRIESDVNASANTGATYAGGNSQSHYGYSGSFNHQAGSKLFDDIFNIPIATLQAVNRLVSNKAAGAHGSVDINKTITVNHS